MLGVEHEKLRGSISLEYYGRNIGLKIMPTGGGGGGLCGNQWCGWWGCVGVRWGGGWLGLWDTIRRGYSAPSGKPNPHLNAPAPLPAPQCTGVNPQRLLDGFAWPEFQWRRGELLSQLQGKVGREAKGGGRAVGCRAGL